MLVMLDIAKEAPQRIHCMVYKQQFKSRAAVSPFLLTSTVLNLISIKI